MQFSKLRLLTFHLVSFLIFSCASSPNANQPVDPRTEKFSQYLKLNFDDSIPNEHHLFIVISSGDSVSTITKILSRIGKKFKNTDSNSYTAIVNSKIQIPDSLFPTGKTHVDWDNAIDKLQMGFKGVTLIQTSEKKVSRILPVTFEPTEAETQFLNW